MSKHIPDLNTPCIDWTGAFDRDGYGRRQVGKKWKAAYRVAYEEHIGPIPNGLVIDHLCRNRKCVNPLHLEAVTNKENIMRGIGVTATNSKKTHCVNGHPLVEVIAGRRRCRICARRRWREYRIRKINKGTWKKT